MKNFRLDNMKGGWFVGDFVPHAVRTTDFEVAIKYYPAGQTEPKHYHAESVELTVIVEGRCHMMGQDWNKGDIILLEKGEQTDFHCYTDVTTCVVKYPSRPHDKILVKE